MTDDLHHSALEFLKHHPMGVLSTVSAEGEPWRAAIYCFAQDDFSFYFFTRTETFKYQNIETNPHVALTIADEDTQTTVQAAGAVTKVDAKQTLVVLKELESIKPKGTVNWIPPIFKVHEGNWMLLKFVPTKLQYANFKEMKSDPTEDYIQKVI